MADKCFRADAIVVLGCRGSAALGRRLEIGIRLFKAGAAPLLVLSGGGSGPMPEAESMRRAAIASGIPEAAVVTEVVSRNTFENARETARLLKARGLRSVILVSDRAHLLRAAVLFHLAGLRVAASAGAPARSLWREAGATLREIAALPWSLLRAIPFLIGPVIREGSPLRNQPRS
ncbi:MAG: YdcF family protein [Alphaproteobacteria bacterium]|nr:YdcF family protein [Alphaproteobacteria bacterium]